MIATTTARPATETEADVAAARAAMFAVRDRTLWNNAWWTDPVLLGERVLRVQVVGIVAALAAIALIAS